MPDTTFDAVIVGGGNKALMLAMYLIKYGGMSVGIFERRHEIGGCLATEELSAPGFKDNTHANIILPWYYAPIYRDFPQYWEYGAQWDQYTCAAGSIFADKNNCLAVYSEKHDPTQERTAKELARFSQKDAEAWLKLWKVRQTDVATAVRIDGIFNPCEFRNDPKMLARQQEFGKMMAMAGFMPDKFLMTTSALHGAQEVFESKELQYTTLRWLLSAAVDITHPYYGARVSSTAITMPTLGFARGGTHQAAHAAHQILVQSGCKFFTHAEVQKVIIENGAATGIRLTDGSQIGARKLVVSTLSPTQLCFDLIGREQIDKKLARRVDLLSTHFGCLMWYSFAVHQAPKYAAAQFNPDMNETFWLGLADDSDPWHIARECYYQQMRKLPPIEDFCPTVWCHSLVDPSYAPPGKHVVQNEQLGPGATSFTEKEWMKIKVEYAQNLIKVWSKHAPNMNWDNIIGQDCNSAYDNLRMKNLGPEGCMAGVDHFAWQDADTRPTPELANHRTPIKNLYATGGAWHVGANAGSAEGYNCYKIIAKDLNLAKPWEEKGKEEPESLVEMEKSVVKRTRDTFKRERVA